MREIISQRKTPIGTFRTKEIWFSDSPYDVYGYDSISFQACKNLVSDKDFKCQEFDTSIIDLTQGLDAVWTKMSSGNCRKPIHRAEKAGIIININQDYDAFYVLYTQIRKLHGVVGLPIDVIKEHATLFTAKFDGQVISGHGYLEDKDNMRSWVIGSARLTDSKEFTTTVANSSKLLIWTAIQYAHAKGIKWFDMGGVYTDADMDKWKANANIFKQSFGGEAARLYVYQKDYSGILRIAKKAQQLLNRKGLSNDNQG